MSRAPTDDERDELIKLDGAYTMEEAARILLAVKPEDLPADEREAAE